MLQKIHQYTRGWIAGAIIALIAITFVFFGISNYLESKVDTSVASVNGEKITKQAVSKAYDQLRQQLARKIGADFHLTAALDVQLKQQAVENLITLHVLQTQAQASGYHVSMQQVDDVIAHIPAFQEEGRFSVERFQRALRSSSLSELSYLQQVQNSLLIDQVRSGIEGGTFVLTQEVNNVIRLMQQARDFRYLQIPLSRFAKQVTISDSQIKNYYQKQREQFKTPEKVSLNYIEISLPELQDKIQISDEEQKSYYDSHKASFTQPKQWRVAHILTKLPTGASEKQISDAKAKSEKIAQQLATGADFSELAKQHSDDNLTADKGGELPWITLGTLGEAFDKALMTLPKVDSVSKPVKTKYGFELIKILAIKQPKPLPYATIKSKIVDLLKQQKAQKQFAEMSETLANLTFSNPDSLEVATERLKLPVKNTPLFTRDEQAEGLLSNKKVINAAFSDDVLLQGNNSELLQLKDNRVVVIRIKDHQQADYVPQAKVEKKIQNILLKKQQKERVAQLGEKILTALEAGKTPTALERQFNLQWKNGNQVTRTQKGIEPEIVQAAFRLPRPNNDQTKPIKGLSLKNGDYVIVQLTAVSDGKIDSIAAADRKALREQLQNARSAVNYELYVKSSMQQAKIKRKNQ